MKKPLRLVPTTMVISAMLFITGCVGLSVGGGSKSENQNPTVGQQLIDLQRARDAGAISEAEYQAQKAKLLQK